MSDFFRETVNKAQLEPFSRENRERELAEQRERLAEDPDRYSSDVDSLEFAKRLKEDFGVVHHAVDPKAKFRDEEKH